MFLLLDCCFRPRPSIWENIIDGLLNLAGNLVAFMYQAIPFILTILAVLAILLLLVASLYACWKLVTSSIHLLNSLVGFGTIAAIQVNRRIETRDREAALRSTHADSEVECCEEESEPCEQPCCHQCCSHDDRRL